MARNQEKGKQNTHRGTIRLVSYLLALISALIAYWMSSGLGKLPAGLASAVVFLLALSLLSDIEKGLTMLRTDVPGALQKMKQVVKRAAKAPTLHPVRDAVRFSIHTYCMSLLRPIQFSSIQYQRMAQGDTQGIVGTVVALASLLFLNLVLTSFIFKRYAAGVSSLWRWILWLCVVPTAVVVWELVSNLRKGPVLKRSFTPVVIWLCITVMWLGDIFNRWMDFSGREMGGAAILIETFLITLVFGSLAGVFFAPSGSQSALGSAFAFVVALVIALGAANRYSVVPQPRELLLEVEADPILATVYRIYEEVGFHTQYSDVPMPKPDGSTPPTNLLMSLHLAVSTLVFIGGWAGFAAGDHGFILRLLEAPLFYAGWFFLLAGRQHRGLQLIELIVRLDEWRVSNWPGEAKCYAGIGHSTPEQLVSIIAPQVFHTPRRLFALKSLASFITSVEPREALKAIIILLPFTQYEGLATRLSPKVSVLGSAYRDSVFDTIYKHRHSVFGDLLGQLSEEEDRRTHAPILTYGPVLDALDTVARSNWKMVSVGIMQASTIRKGLRDYQDVPHARGLYLLATAIEESLSVVELKQIAHTVTAWQAFREEAKHDETLAPCRNYAEQFLAFAELMQELKGTDLTILAQSAFRYLAIQEMLAQEWARSQELLGLREFNLTANHWGSLLRAVIRQCRQ